MVFPAHQRMHVARTYEPWFQAKRYFFSAASASAFALRVASYRWRFRVEDARLGWGIVSQSPDAVDREEPPKVWVSLGLKEARPSHRFHSSGQRRARGLRVADSRTGHDVASGGQLTSHSAKPKGRADLSPASTASSSRIPDTKSPDSFARQALAHTASGEVPTNRWGYDREREGERAEPRRPSSCTSPPQAQGGNHREPPSSVCRSPDLAPLQMRVADDLT